FTVYALYSEKHHKIYIGYTSNIEQRLLAHNELETKGFTLKYRPWKVMYTEAFDEKSEAMKREKQLKTAKGREFVWSLVG
ncbi:MAG: GIY-YIG nuclease family protein, partial [Bacteroidetes bacterium]|nr:GIY-YIG nuclease family protein [Bacteroidota bacterium]